VQTTKRQQYTGPPIHIDKPSRAGLNLATSLVAKNVRCMPYTTGLPASSAPQWEEDQTLAAPRPSAIAALSFCTQGMQVVPPTPAHNTAMLHAMGAYVWCMGQASRFDSATSCKFHPMATVSQCQHPQLHCRRLFQQLCGLQRSCFECCLQCSKRSSDCTPEHKHLWQAQSMSCRDCITAQHTQQQCQDTHGQPQHRHPDVHQVPQPPTLSLATQQTVLQKASTMQSRGRSIGNRTTLQASTLLVTKPL